MELKEFVSLSITEIFNGIIEAQNLISESKEGLINPIGDSELFAEKHIYKKEFREELTKLKFKVAVVAIEKEGAKAGITVFSGLFGAGANTSMEFQDSVSSTIEFEVPVVFPAHRKRGSGDTPTKVIDKTPRAKTTYS